MKLTSRSWISNWTNSDGRITAKDQKRFIIFPIIWVSQEMKFQQRDVEYLFEQPVMEALLQTKPPLLSPGRSRKSQKDEGSGLCEADFPSIYHPKIKFKSISNNNWNMSSTHSEEGSKEFHWFPNHSGFSRNEIPTNRSWISNQTATVGMVLKNCTFTDHEKIHRKKILRSF